MEVKFLTSEGTLTAFPFWVAYFNLIEIITEIKQENLKNIYLNIALYDIGKT